MQPLFDFIFGYRPAAPKCLCCKAAERVLWLMEGNTCIEFQLKPIYLPTKCRLLVQTLNKLLRHVSAHVHHLPGERQRVGETHLMFLLTRNVQ